jgi:hypothetical protein
VTYAATSDTHRGECSPPTLVAGSFAIEVCDTSGSLVGGQAHALEISNCPPSYFLDDKGSVCKCLAGSYDKGSECAKYTEGSFASVAGATECDACPKHQTSDLARTRCECEADYSEITTAKIPAANVCFVRAKSRVLGTAQSGTGVWTLGSGARVRSRQTCGTVGSARSRAPAQTPASKIAAPPTVLGTGPTAHVDMLDRSVQRVTRTTSWDGTIIAKIAVEVRYTVQPLPSVPLHWRRSVQVQASYSLRRDGSWIVVSIELRSASTVLER